MSPDGSARAAGPRPVLLVVTILLALVAAVAVWALVPRDLGTLTIERVRLLPAGAPDGGTKPAALATPVRIAITFAVPQDLASLREGLRIGYVAARLADCRDGDAATQEVIVQRADYLGDYGRVTRLGTGADGRTRYRAVFDDELTATVDHAARRTPAHATPGGLCLSLYGANMWFGHARSAAVPIGPLPR